MRGPPPGALASLLLLADQRLPAGSHAHSAGVEQAVFDGAIHDLDTLEAFCLRRLHHGTAVAAGVAAAAVVTPLEDVPALEAELEARLPSAAQRASSRAAGRGLLRVARASWPHTGWEALGRHPHHPLVLGRAAAVAGVAPTEAATAACYLALAQVTTAALRLLGLDPVAVAALTARLGPQVEAVARWAGESAAEATSWAELPDPGDFWSDRLAEEHRRPGVRLFAS